VSLDPAPERVFVPSWKPERVRCPSTVRCFLRCPRREAGLYARTPTRLSWVACRPPYRRGRLTYAAA
jgi:hypothetical protein